VAAAGAIAPGKVSRAAAGTTSRNSPLLERLALTSSGQVRYQLRTAYRDGNAHCAENCLDLMTRLVALVPPLKDAPDKVSWGVRACASRLRLPLAATPMQRTGGTGVRLHALRADVQVPWSEAVP